MFSTWLTNKKLIKNFIEELQKRYYEFFFQSKNTFTKERIEFYLNQLLFEKGSERKSIIDNFYNEFPNLLDIYTLDLNHFFDCDPASNDKEEIFFLYPGFFAIFVFRIAHLLYQSKAKYLPRMLTEYVHSQTGIDIHPGATIGKAFFIDHGTGIVIGETSIIGDYVRMYQGATLGALSLKEGHALQGTKRHPTIGNHVILYANSVVLGGNTFVGDYSVIGGGVFIQKSVKEKTLVYLQDGKEVFIER